VQALYRSVEDLEADWRVNAQRQTILEALAERGLDLTKLSGVAGTPDADPLDLLCHLAVTEIMASTVRFWPSALFPDFEYDPHTITVWRAGFDRHCKTRRQHK
jgi:hypothetical protein